MSANEILQKWIQDANQGRIKDGKRELSNNELALIGSVLRAVAGDVLVQTPAEPQGDAPRIFLAPETEKGVEVEEWIQERIQAAEQRATRAARMAIKVCMEQRGDIAFIDEYLPGGIFCADTQKEGKGMSEQHVHTGQAVGWYRCDGRDCPICNSVPSKEWVDRLRQEAAPAEPQGDAPSVFTGKSLSSLYHNCENWDICARAVNLRIHKAEQRALGAAAIHSPLAYTRQGDIWIECSCGWNKGGLLRKNIGGKESWASHIRALYAPAQTPSE